MRVLPWHPHRKTRSLGPSLPIASRVIDCVFFSGTSIKSDVLPLIQLYQAQKTHSEKPSVAPTSTDTQCESFRGTHIERHAVSLLPWHPHRERRSVTPSVAAASRGTYCKSSKDLMVRPLRRAAVRCLLKLCVIICFARSVQKFKPILRNLLIALIRVNVVSKTSSR